MRRGAEIVICSASFKGDDHLTGKPSVEATDVIFIVPQFTAMNYDIGRVAAVNGLLTGVEA